MTLDLFQNYANAIRDELLGAFPRSFDNYRRRALLAASGRRPWRKYLLTLDYEGRLIITLVILATLYGRSLGNLLFELVLVAQKKVRSMIYFYAI
ncbi:hypothetical protein ACFYE2_03675 [Kocuria sp. CPCC 205300]|uniref:hypothetical protein n=1 Tax=Kocuria sabuli TaxID=3071448 RepID=UPI0036DFA49C